MTKPAPEDPTQPAEATVPAAGGVLRCAHCQRANAANRKFCSACGKPMWEPCLNCGTTCAAGETFCGHCGISLSAAVEQRLAQIVSVCREAEALAVRHEFGPALSHLQKLTGLSDHRLASAARRVEELRVQLVSQQRA